MAYDLVVKDALIVDGTGKKAYAGDVAVENGNIVAVGKVDGGAVRTIRGQRTGGGAWVHRRPYALRRAAPLGSICEPLDSARCDVGPHGQLRVHPRAGPE